MLLHSNGRTGKGRTTLQYGYPVQQHGILVICNAGKIKCSLPGHELQQHDAVAKHISLLRRLASGEEMGLQLEVFQVEEEIPTEQQGLTGSRQPWFPAASSEKKETAADASKGVCRETPTMTYKTWRGKLFRDVGIDPEKLFWSSFLCQNSQEVCQSRHSADSQELECWKLAEAGRYGPCEHIVLDLKADQVGQVAELRWLQRDKYI
eukprot:SM000037S13512  [mRNA]  locus=s37:326384:329581:+ [translate_table: standard]